MQERVKRMIDLSSIGYLVSVVLFTPMQCETVVQKDCLRPNIHAINVVDQHSLEDLYPCLLPGW